MPTFVADLPLHEPGTDAGRWRRSLGLLLCAAVLVTGVAATAQVVRIGDSGHYPCDSSASPYSSCQFHHTYGGVWGWPSGESSHCS